MTTTNLAQVVRDARAAGKALQEACTLFKVTVSQVEAALTSMGLHASAEVPLPCGFHLAFWVQAQPVDAKQVGRLMVRGTRGARPLGALRGQHAIEAVAALPDLLRKLTQEAQAATADLHGHADGLEKILRAPREG